MTYNVWNGEWSNDWVNKLMNSWTMSGWKKKLSVNKWNKEWIMKILKHKINKWINQRTKVWIIGNNESLMKI